MNKNKDIILEIKINKERLKRIEEGLLYERAESKAFEE